MTDWEEEWLAIKDVKEVKQKLRDAMDSLEVLFLLYDPKVRMLLDALMFELVLVWPMVILLKSRCRGSGLKMELMIIDLQGFILNLFQRQY